MGPILSFVVWVLGFVFVALANFLNLRDVHRAKVLRGNINALRIDHKQDKAQIGKRHLDEIAAKEKEHRRECQEKDKLLEHWREKHNHLVEVMKEHPAQIKANLAASDRERAEIQGMLDQTTSLLISCQRELRRAGDAQAERERKEKDAPFLTISQGGDQLSITNDTAQDARKVTVGAIEYQRRFLLANNPESIPRLSGRDTKSMQIQLDTNTLEARAIALEALTATGEHVDGPYTMDAVFSRRGKRTVRVEFEDTDGNEFEQRFEVVRRDTGVIEWKPLAASATLRL